MGRARPHRDGHRNDAGGGGGAPFPLDRPWPLSARHSRSPPPCSNPRRGGLPGRRAHCPHSSSPPPPPAQGGGGGYKRGSPRQASALSTQ
eukprot:613915-Prorocentrum_minimum.AAC.1